MGAGVAPDAGPGFAFAVISGVAGVIVVGLLVCRCYHAVVHWVAGQGHHVAVVIQHMDVVVACRASGTSIAAGSPITDAAATPLAGSTSAAMSVGARPSTRASPRAAEAPGVSPTSASRRRRGVGS